MYSRGSVYLVKDGNTSGSEIRKTRPWILIGASPLNKARSTVICIPLTTKQKALPKLCIDILLNNTPCVAILDQIRAIDKQSLIQKEGFISSHELDLIEDGLRHILCL